MRRRAEIGAIAGSGRSRSVRIFPTRRPLCTQATRHCVPSRIVRNPLKTNDRGTFYSTLNQGVAVTRSAAILAAFLTFLSRGIPPAGCRRYVTDELVAGNGADFGSGGDDGGERRGRGWHRGFFSAEAQAVH